MSDRTSDEIARATALMQRYCDGDARAFDELYPLVAPRLFAHLLTITANRAQAEDALQQTFLKLHGARAAYLRGADPLPWLYTIARRAAVDEHRRRRRLRAPSDGAPLPEEPTAGLRGLPDDDLDEEAARGQLARVAIAAVATLPASHREAITLTKLRGCSVAEAAQLLGTTPLAVKLRVHRGMIKLRALLDRDLRGEPAAI